MNELTDLNIWREHYDLNVFIPIVLNGIIMNMFNSTGIKKLVINVTSLFGIQAGYGCGYYCSSKAAREMFFKVCSETIFFNVLRLYIYIIKSY